MISRQKKKTLQVFSNFQSLQADRKYLLKKDDSPNFQQLSVTTQADRKYLVKYNGFKKIGKGREK